MAMEYYDLSREKYIKIVNFICSYNGIKENELYKLLKDKECKYLLFLLLKKYKCTNKDILIDILGQNNKSTISYNFKKAEEKFFVNRELREKYFEVEDILQKII